MERGIKCRGNGVIFVLVLTLGMVGTCQAAAEGGGDNRDYQQLESLRVQCADLTPAWNYARRAGVAGCVGAWAFAMSLCVQLSTPGCSTQMPCNVGNLVFESIGGGCAAAALWYGARGFRSLDRLRDRFMPPAPPALASRNARDGERA